MTILQHGDIVKCNSVKRIKGETKSMKTLEKISNWAGKYMAFLVIIVTIISMVIPGPVKSVIKTSYVNPLLQIVMFGMGLTLSAKDFQVVFSRPKDVIIGFCAQFAIMPFLAWLLCKIFRLPTEIAIGVILVGTCPGGTASNVMSYLANGDVALSVGMTACSTIAAPFMTPWLTYVYAGQSVNVNMMSMFISIIQVVLVPIVLGLIINHFFGEITKQVAKILPLVSVIAIMLIIMAVVSANAAKLMTSGLLIIVVVMCHNLLGYAGGFFVSKALGLDMKKAKTIAIEVGMQNSGLATSLAATHFAQYPLATIPGAVFSVWHNLSGAVFANLMADKNEY